MSRDIGLPSRVSDLARPPIRSDEAIGSETAICPYHGSRYSHMNVEGKVYYCPLGGQFWRASNTTDSMHAPLKFAKGL